MFQKPLLLATIALFLSTAAYAGLTKSPDGLPLDSRIRLDGSNGTVFGLSYLDNQMQFQQIDDGLVYLNCAEEINPTSAFNFDVESYAKSQNFTTSLIETYKENCTNKVLISVAHYIDPKITKRKQCVNLLKLSTKQKVSRSLTETIVKGANITTLSPIMPSTPGYDFSISKTDRPISSQGLPICTHEARSNDGHKYILPQLSHLISTISMTEAQHTAVFFLLNAKFMN